jgi:uncharacterized protein (DUF433 family)
MRPAQATTPKQHVTSTPDVCGGKPCIAGTRIRVWDIAARAQAGDSPDEILSDFPHLTLADIHAALAYYYDFREEIEQQMAADEAFVQSLREQLGPGPLEANLAADKKQSPSGRE